MANKNARLSAGKRALFTGIFLLFFLLLLEGAARLVCLLPGVQSPHRICRFESESQNREYEFVERKNRNLESEYQYDMYSPTLGWKPRPGFDGNVTKPGMATYHVRINARGARSDREIPYDRVPGLFRVVVLGASQTFGEGVSNGECYSDLLERRLEGTEWINLAVHGYANDQMLLYLEEEGARYKPDLILFGFHPSTIYRNTINFRSFAKPMFVLEGGTLKLTNVPVPTPEEVLERNRLHPVQPDCSDPRNLSYLYRYLQQALENAYLERGRYLESSSFLRSVYPWAKKILKSFMKESSTAKKFKLQGKEWTLTQKIFEEVHRIAQQDRARLLLVLYPGSTEEFEEEVERFAREQGIPFCNISPPFRQLMQEKGPGAFSLPDGHWNAAGHELAAQAIEACLRQTLGEEGMKKKGAP